MAVPPLLDLFRDVRTRTVRACARLTPEDAQVQSMPDASPAKWHLAHTTWFFETFVLAPLGIAPVDPHFAFLFNSYYDGVGARVERGRRGLMSRPTLEEVSAYRVAVDDRVAHAILEGRAAAEVVELGLHHEQQHQELLLTDLKHALGTQPLRPAYVPGLSRPALPPAAAMSWREHSGGIVEIGAAAGGFAFDNERPRHRALVEPFALASREVTNGDVLAFIADGGYRQPAHWLSDGWATVQRDGWTAPLYWRARDGRDRDWELYDLAGVRAVDPHETACHLSLYEADALARWAGARLPIEAEWEVAAAAHAPAPHVADEADGAGDTGELGRLHPGAPSRSMFGDVWQWTSSAYAPYPGFTPLAGALGEYNGKFMSGQVVLRGGSCFTPRGHVRASYRNFFPPSARWQMTGVRFARDVRTAARSPSP